MFTVLQHGHVYTPEYIGPADVLMVNDRIGHVGTVNVRALEHTGFATDVIDVHGCAVCPGLIDPHEHLLGGSGEEGFSSPAATTCRQLRSPRVCATT